MRTGTQAATERWADSTRNRGFSTGVTHILRRISDSLLGDETALIPTGEGGGTRFLVAGDRETRERAYRLAYRIYHDAGLAAYDPQGLILSEHDATDRAFTVLVENEAGEDIATVSLVRDSERGLPCDEIFGADLRALRGRGRRLAEVVRLAIRREHGDSRRVMAGMTNMIGVYARRVWGTTDYVIEVHPRHAPYYRRFHLFEDMGSERPCPRVGGAPAMLLKLDLSVQAREILAVGGKEGQGRSEKGKTIYAYYQPMEVEGPMAEFMANAYAPMSQVETAYFGLSETAAAVEVGGEPVLAAM